MKQHYYLGALELAFDISSDVSVQEFNRLFLQPVLPVTLRSQVQIVPKSRLEVPYAVSERQVKASWEKDDMEYCAYSQQGNWLSVSQLSPDGNITIYVQESRLGLFTISFRPWYQMQLEKLLLRNCALILHSASIEYRGEAILFTAPSGTGKTTQTDLWHKFVSGVTDLNGDKTLLQKTEKGWFACGFPIYGSSMRCAQKALPVRAIVVVRQSKTDRVKELSSFQKVTFLYSEITVPKAEARYVTKTMDLIEEIVSQIPVLQLDCTMKPDAVRTLHQYLYQQGEGGMMADGII